MFFGRKRQNSRDEKWWTYNFNLGDYTTSHRDANDTLDRGNDTYSTPIEDRQYNESTPWYVGSTTFTSNGVHNILNRDNVKCLAIVKYV